MSETTELPSLPILLLPFKSSWLFTNNAFAFHDLSCQSMAVRHLVRFLRSASDKGCGQHRTGKTIHEQSQRAEEIQRHSVRRW